MLKTIFVFVMLSSILGAALQSPRAGFALGAILLLWDAHSRLKKRVDALEKTLAERPLATDSAQPEPQASAVLPVTPISPQTEVAVAPVDAPSPAPISVQTDAAPPAPSLTPTSSAPAVRSWPIEAMESPVRKNLQAWAEPLSALIKKNFLALIGIALILVGLGFLFAIVDVARLLTPEVRVMLAVALGGILAFVGWRMRSRHGAYAQVLQGGGMAIIYLALYVATAHYEMVAPLAALAGFAVLSALTVAASLHQHSQMLVFVGFAGAYLAPVLTVHGTDRLEWVLAFALLVSVAAVASALARAWWALIVLAFCASSLIAMGTYVGHSAAIALWVQHLLVAAWATLFSVAAPLYTRKNNPSPIPPALYAIHALTPVTSFALEYWIGGRPGAGIAGLIMAVGYGGMWRTLRNAMPQLSRLSMMLAALCAVFALLTLFEDIKLTVALVGIPGLVLHFAAQDRPWGRKLARGFFALAILLFYQHSIDSIASGVVLALMLWAASWKSGRGDRKLEADVLALIGAAVLLSAVAHFTYRETADLGMANMMMLGISTVCAAIGAVLHVRHVWPACRMLGVPVLVFWLVSLAIPVNSQDWGEVLRWVLLLGLLGAGGAFCNRREGKFYPEVRLLCVALAALALRILAGNHFSGWEGADPFWNLAVIALLLFGFCGRATIPRWVGDSQRENLLTAHVLIQIAAAFCLLITFANYPASLGKSSLLEPVLPVWLLVAALMAISGPSAQRSMRVPLLAGAALTYLLLRVFGVFEGFEGRPQALLFSSSSVQPAISFGWAVLGLLLLRHAVRQGSRNLWQRGAAVFLATGIKLIAFDTASVDTLYRVISFIGAGLAFLLAGYLAPLPPDRKNKNPDPANPS